MALEILRQSVSLGRWQVPHGDRETKAGGLRAERGQAENSGSSQVKPILMIQILLEKNITLPRARLRQCFSPEALTRSQTRHVRGATVEVIFSGNFPPRQGTLTALAWVKLPFNRWSTGSVAPRVPACLTCGLRRRRTSSPDIPPCLSGWRR